MKTKKRDDGKKLELEYQRFFRPSRITKREEERISLAQPHERTVVPSFVTYGAYEEPI
jgi:hypothetical protein